MDVQDKPTTIVYWVALMLAAAAVRVLVACVFFGSLPDSSDPLVYAKFAERMIDGSSAGHVYKWTPGRSYALAPFFLAFGTSSAVIKANSIFFDVGGALAAAILAHQVLRRRSAARLSGWVAAFYPPAIMLSGMSYTMNVTMFGLLCGTCFAILGWRVMEKHAAGSLAAWFASGGCFGFATLVRASSASVVLAGVAAWLLWFVLRCFKPSLAGAAARVSPLLILSMAAAFC